ncbi:MAG: hypothetical protein ACREIH_06515 [Nitrospiraceae bacterium]
MRTILLKLGSGVLLAGVVWLTNNAIQKGYLGVRPRALAQFYAPMYDLYDNVLEAPINVATSGRRFHYRFSNRYSGRHVFGVLACRDFDVPTPSSYAKNLALSISCRVGNEVVYARHRQEEVSPWWKPKDHKQGFSLFVYTVPGDFPRRTLIDCDVQVCEGDAEFAERYEICAFYAGKESEE